MKNSPDIKEYVDNLRDSGFSSQEIRVAIDIKVNGITMTKAIYKFNEMYDTGKIDGFPDSSIDVLKMFYGKSLEKMKPKTLFKKIYQLQRCLVENPDEENITDAINNYLS